MTLTKLEGDYNYYNNDYFDLYMKEVNNDINFMITFLKFPKFEIEQEPYFKILIDKYNKNYCLSTLYKYFSDQNKLEYCYKRVEIDELLEKYNLKISE